MPKKNSPLSDPVLAQPWLITPSWLSVLAEQPDRESLAAYEGEPLVGADLVDMRGDVAVIRIQGPIIRYSTFYSRYYRCTPLDVLALEFRQAVDNPAIKAILLDIDSPGGQANGINEMAEMIYQARDVKPVSAYVGGLGDSGAYWLATAAGDLALDATAEVGSIGVVQVWTDFQKMDERLGIRTFEIVSSASPNKRPDPATEGGRDLIRGQLDVLADVFIRTVARNRGVSVETVRKDFGQGGVFIGSQAVERGMADRLSSFEEVLSGLRESTKEGIFMPNQASGEAPAITREMIAADHPGIAEAFRSEGFEKGLAEGKAAGMAEGKQAGITEERERIKGIESLSVPGHDALLSKLKFEEPVSAEQAAVRIIQAEKAQRDAVSRDLAQDAAEVAGVKPSTDREADSQEESMSKAIAFGANERRQ